MYTEYRGRDLNPRRTRLPHVVGIVGSPYGDLWFGAAGVPIVSRVVCHWPYVFHLGRSEVVAFNHGRHDSVDTAVLNKLRKHDLFENNRKT